MKNLLLRAGAIALALLAAPALAQVPPGTPAKAPAGFLPGGAQFCSSDSGQTWVPCPPATGGGGGGSGGDASAANQTSQITAANLTNATLGSAVASPAPYTLADRLKVLNTTLGSPFQSGGSIGNTAFGISGTLPGFAATPTVDIVIKGTATDRGGFVGTTAVTLAPINAARRGFAIQIQDAVASCYVNGTTAATADYHSLQVGSGGYYQTPDGHVGTGAISVICTAPSVSVYMREW